MTGSFRSNDHHRDAISSSTASPRRPIQSTFTIAPGTAATAQSRYDYSTPTRKSTTPNAAAVVSPSPFSPTPPPTTSSNSNNNGSCNNRSIRSALFWFVMGVCCTCTVLFQHWSMMVAISSNDPRLLDVAAAVPQTTYGSAAERIFWSQQQQQYPSTRVKKKSTPDIHKQYSEERRTDATALSEERQRLYQYKAPDDEDSTRTRSIHTATTTDNNNNNTILCGSPPLYETYFGQPKRMTRSMSDEDATIYNLFFRDYYTSTPERNNNNLHPKDATAAAAADDKAFHYVELGAFNGITESNTRFYDECLGWEGLLVEANPRIFPELIENRPRAHRCSFAASCSAGEERNNATVGFWSSIYTNAVQDDVENRQAYADKPPAESAGGPPKVQVPCGSLTPVLLHAFPNGRVHFFSLDVEGAEPGVVANIDFDQIFIDVLISENLNQYCRKTCPSRDQTRALMQSRGYLLFPDVVTRSDLFVHPRSDVAEQFLTRQTLYDSVEVEAALAKSTRHSGLLRNALESTAVVPKAPLSTQWAKFQHHVPIRRSASNLQSATEFCGTMPQFDNFWNLSSLVRSRLDEDKTIYNTFFKHLSQSDMKDFHYIELGAFDGAQESNTRFFDLCLGWKGLLIEPNPRIFPKLVDNRPHAHRMSYAASCSAAEETNDATVGFWASKFTNSAQDQSPNREAYANRAKLLTNVPCGSLNPVILDLFPGGRVHFFSLDTEGTEHKVLEHIDFSQVHIDVLISENKNKFCLEQCEARDKTRALMKANGYVLYANTIPHSDLYVHPRSEFAGMITSG